MENTITSLRFVPTQGKSEELEDTSEGWRHTARRAEGRERDLSTMIRRRSTTMPSVSGVRHASIGRPQGTYKLSANVKRGRARGSLPERNDPVADVVSACAYDERRLLDIIGSLLRRMLFHLLRIRGCIEKESALIT